MVKRNFPNWAIFSFKLGSAALMLIGFVFLVESYAFKENVSLFEKGIAFIAIGIAFISALFGFVNWDDTRELKEQLDRIEKK